MKREPADRKKEKDQSQGLGQIQLLVIVLVGIRVVAGELLAVELLVDHVEDFCVDNQHEEQRRQHPSKEVEVNHVVHADDIFKQAGDDEVGVAVVSLLKVIVQVVPA